MAFSFIIILCVLAVLILAFVGVFGRFPDNWEWVGIILAGWGIAMSAPSVFQILVGRAQLLTNYDRLVHGQKRGLLIFLKNPPIERSIWRRLGVTRNTIASLSISFCITEIGTNKVMTQPLMHARIYSDDDPTETGSWRIALPPTFTWSTSIMIAMWNDTKKKAIILPDRVRNSLELPSGTYQLEVVFLVDGQRKKEFRRFVVVTLPHS